MMRYIWNLIDPSVHQSKGKWKPKIPFWKRLLTGRGK